MKLKLLLIAMVLLTHFAGNTQLIYSQVSNLEALITNIFGIHCQSISNISIAGNSAIQLGRFEQGQIIGLNKGIIMTTGIPTSNTHHLTQISVNVHQPGDPDIIDYNNLTGPGATSYDALVIEFDFHPTNTDSIHFKYVFASEEYPEYTNSQYNDRFLFLVSEDGNTPVNIAVLPGTNTVVEINNVNQYSNTAFFNLTAASTDSIILNNFPYDGYTVPLVASFFAQSGHHYHIKLIIADVQDELYDSAIFLEEQDVYTNLSGWLSVDNNPAQGIIDVYSIAQLNTLATPIQTINVTNGHYNTDSLINGSYHFRFTPNLATHPNALPSYFYNGTHWSTATEIAVPCFLNNVDIDASTSSIGNGTSSISGNLTIDTTFLRTATIPLTNALILLKNQFTNTTLAFTLSDENGDYLFTNIPTGNYYIQLDVPYIPHQDTIFIALSEATKYYHVDYEITPEGIISSGEPEVGIEKIEQHQFKVFPNPASTNINVQSKEIIEKLQIIDTRGTVIREIYPNNFESTIQIQGLNSGIYLLNVNDYLPQIITITAN